MMPGIFGAIFLLIIFAGMGFFIWKIYEKAERRKKEKEQMEHELKIKLHKPTIKANLKLEKARMKYELKTNKHKSTIIKENRKRKKDRMVHELHMNDKETTADKAIVIIPETTKNIGNIISNLINFIKFKKK